MNPWQLFEEALDAVGAHRTALLDKAESRLGRALGAGQGEMAILSACIAAVRAGEGQVAIEEARDAAAMTSELEGSGWPGYHLAEAADRLGRYDMVLEALSLVSPEFFEAQDLVWRAVRCAELQAVALMRTGESWASVSRIVSALVSKYANFGETEDLAPPRDLVLTLLDGPRPRILALEQLAHSIDFQEWFGEEITQRASTALARAEISDD